MTEEQSQLAGKMRRLLQFVDVIVIAVRRVKKIRRQAGIREKIQAEVGGGRPPKRTRSGFSLCGPLYNSDRIPLRGCVRCCEGGGVKADSVLRRLHAPETDKLARRAKKKDGKG